MKVVFFGTPAFAAKVLEYLLSHNVNIVAVITKPDKPQGRSSQLIPTPVKTVALSHHIPVYQPALVSDMEFAPILSQYDADLFVVVAYGEIIKQHLLDMPKKACINLHASLLPKYRGAAPIQRCIINGEKESGLTVMHMVKKMDAGDIISSVVVPIGEETTYGDLEAMLCEAGKELLLQAIQDFDKGTPPQTPQDASQVTYAPKIEPEECQIDWNKPAQEVHNLVRGVYPSPCAWCYVMLKGEQKRLKVLKARVANGTETGIVVPCGEGALEILELQLEGKKAMSAAEFKRGSQGQLLF